MRTIFNSVIQILQSQLTKNTWFPISNCLMVKFVQKNSQDVKTSSSVVRSITKQAKSETRVQKDTYYMARMKESLHSTNTNEKMGISYRAHLYQNFVIFNKFKLKFEGLANQACSHLKPQEDQKLHLVFDLDDTLIRTVTTPGKGDLSAELTDEEGPLRFYFRIRPFTQKILSQLRLYYHMYVFTTAQQDYATKVLQQLDPKRQFFQKVLTRKDCTVRDGVALKDLKLVCADLKRVVIVDNSLTSYLGNILNGIPIIPFQHDQDDELLSLYNFLLNIVSSSDLRVQISKQFNPIWLYSGGWTLARAQRREKLVL